MAHESARPCGCDPGAHWICEQHRGLDHSYIELDGIIAVGSSAPIAEAMALQREVNRLNSLSMESIVVVHAGECSFCGFTLKPTDTFCCPECGWKLQSKGTK